MRKRLAQRLTYANLVSTLALFLVLGGGAAYAANKIRSGDIANGAVKTAKLHERAVISGKLAVGAVRSNQIADGAVGSAQIGAGSILPSDLQVPLAFVANPTGGDAPVQAGEPNPYPLAGRSWTQGPGQVNVIFGEARAALAYDGGGSGSCRAFIELILNGRQVGGGEISTSSETLETVQGSLGANPEIDPPDPRTNTLTARLGSNGECTGGSRIMSTRFKVLDFG
jgi:hypothetical protein